MIPATKTARKPEPWSDRGGAVDRARGEHHGEWIERPVGKRRPAKQAAERDGAGDPDDEADRPSRSTNSRSTIANEPPSVGRELDHADHQGDADRVVEARLALEDRARAAVDLLPGEHGERHRRIGRGERRADQPRDGPREVEQRSAPPPRRAPRCRRCRRRRAIDDRHRRARGSAASRCFVPPSKRITTSASVATRWTSWKVSDRREPVDEVGRDRRDDEQQAGGRERRGAPRRRGRRSRARAPPRRRG